MEFDVSKELSREMYKLVYQFHLAGKDIEISHQERSQLVADLINSLHLPPDALDELYYDLIDKESLGG